jgi:hypothetical protein
MAGRRIYNRPTTPAACRLSEPAKRMIDLLALRSGLTASQVMRALLETKLAELGFPVDPGEAGVLLSDHATVEAWQRGDLRAR